MDNFNDSIVNEIAVDLKPSSIITVVGVGGAGGNAVNYMWEMGIRNVEFLVCNTDQLALSNSPIANKIRLGDDGLGAGNDPVKGRDAAIESIEMVRERLLSMNTHMAFITAGMGGGTGTGAAPVIAKLAREMGILTVAIVTSPLLVEGQLRYDQAMKGISELRESVDSLLIINNENIKNIYLSKNSNSQNVYAENYEPSACEAFSKANEILSCAAKGISEIITVESTYIHVDFADVSKVMRNSGRAHMSVEKASGEDRALTVAKQSLSSPLLDHNHIAGAKDILLNMAVSKLENLKFSEVNKILNHIQSNARVITGDGEVGTANIIWGMSEKPELGDDLELVMVATGFDNNDTIDDFGRGLYSDKLLMIFNDPISPIMRLAEIQKRSNNGEKSSVQSKREVTVVGDKVMLPERELRYPSINGFLKVPAYSARKAKLRCETEANPKDCN